MHHLWNLRLRFRQVIVCSHSLCILLYPSLWIASNCSSQHIYLKIVASIILPFSAPSFLLSSSVASMRCSLFLIYCSHTLDYCLLQAAIFITVSLLKSYWITRLPCLQENYLQSLQDFVFCFKRLDLLLFHRIHSLLLHNLHCRHYLNCLDCLDCLLLHRPRHCLRGQQFLNVLNVTWGCFSKKEMLLSFCCIY